MNLRQKRLCAQLLPPEAEAEAAPEPQTTSPAAVTSERKEPECPTNQAEIEREPGEREWLLQAWQKGREEIATLRSQLRSLEQKFREAHLEEDPAIIRARRHLFRQLMHLVPKALEDAKKGKPALLRLIVRTVRLR
jgi:hypothetical protein